MNATETDVYPAYRVWNCGRCNSELVTAGDYLTCESCGSWFRESGPHTADYVGDYHPDHPEPGDEDD